MDYKAIILEKLDLLRKKETQDKNVFKARAYAKVIAQIREVAAPIHGLSDVVAIPGVGAKIKDKLAEIFATGTLGAADRVPATIKAADLLMKVHGVGPVKARQLVDDGIRTIADLRADETVLNQVQRTGLKYFEDLQTRIPRADQLDSLGL